jgi:long-chain acyl-CoA synthetase
VGIKIADDGEILISGKNIFSGYWRNEAASKEAFAEDGWLATGDVGELDDEGFLTITGRKKEMIVTAGGKNVAPAVLEDRLRSHALISQCMVVGDGKPFIAALITLDLEALGPWKERHGKPADATVVALRDDPELVAEVQTAVDDAIQGRVHQEVPDSRYRLHPGGGAAHRQARDPPERAAEGLRGRYRCPVLVGRVSSSGIR